MKLKAEHTRGQTESRTEDKPEECAKNNDDERREFAWTVIRTRFSPRDFI